MALRTQGLFKREISEFELGRMDMSSALLIHRGLRRSWSTTSIAEVEAVSAISSNDVHPRPVPHHSALVDHDQSVAFVLAPVSTVDISTHLALGYSKFA